MRRRRLIVLLSTGAAIVALFAIVASRRDREPEYGGRKLSRWLLAYRQALSTWPLEERERHEREAVEAIQHIGTNALPWLLKWTDYEPPSWKRSFWDSRTAPTRPKWLPYRLYLRLFARLARSRALDRSLDAEDGFYILGPQAAVAIPELERRLEDQTKPWRVARAAWALAGVEGSNSVPALLKLLTSTNASCRSSACFALALLETNAIAAGPALTNALNDPDAVVRRFATAALSRISPKAPVPPASANAEAQTPQRSDGK